MTDKSISRVPSLDGLRGFAVVLVFAAHAGSEGLIYNGPLFTGLGKIGVILFYVLSGFLMGVLYLDKSISRKALAQYVISRVARVLPLFYFLVLLAFALLVATGFSLYGFQTLPQSMLNFALIRGNGVLWSIPVEIQFYLLFALLWLARSKNFLAGSISILFLTQIFILLMFPASNVHILPYWVHFFIIGIVISLLHPLLKGAFGKIKSSYLSIFLGLAGFLFCAALTPGFRSAYFPFYIPTYADPFLIFAVVIFFYLSIESIGPFIFFETKAMRWLGDHSFGIYLIHAPVMVVLTPLFSQNAISTGVAAASVALISIGAAVVSRRFIEIPAAHFMRTRLTNICLSDKIRLPEIMVWNVSLYSLPIKFIGKRHGSSRLES